MSVSALASHIDSVALIDHHMHGCWLRAGDRHRSGAEPGQIVEIGAAVAAAGRGTRFMRIRA